MTNEQEPQAYPIGEKQLPLRWTHTFYNIDDQAACLAGYDQQYQQMSAGLYKGRFETIDVDSELGLYFETFNQKMDQWGASPPDRYGFAFFTHGKLESTFGSVTFTGDHVLIMPPGKSFSCRAEANTGFCVVSVDKVAFENALGDAHLRDDVCKRIAMSTQFFVHCATIKHLRSSVAFLARLASGEDQRAFPGVMQSSKRALIHFLVGIASDAYAATSLLEQEKLDYRARLAGAAQREFRENLGANFSPQEIADRFGVSRRSLEKIFREFFQQSPLEYNKAVKLNSFRSALLKPENQGQTIGDIAAQFGIWHLGRLSSDYRGFFGELPSETRKRAKKNKVLGHVGK